jgi:hypothetical protein
MQKSIFDYVVDVNRYKNNNQCNNFTPPFITNVQFVQASNVDIESDLKGVTRQLSKCVSNKYIPPAQLGANPNNLAECEDKYRILPQGYLRRN